MTKMSFPQQIRLNDNLKMWWKLINYYYFFHLEVWCFLKTTLSQKSPELKKHQTDTEQTLNQSTACLILRSIMFPSFPEVFLIPVLSPVVLRLVPVRRCAPAQTISWTAEEKVWRQFQPTCLKAWLRCECVLLQIYRLTVLTTCEK